MWQSALGQLAAFTTAVRLAPLMGRWLRETLDLEADVYSREWAAALLTFWTESLPRLNGGLRVELAREVLEVFGDTSATGYSAIAPQLGWRFVAAFSKQLRTETAAGEHSSALRELWGYYRCLDALVRAHAATLVDRAVQFWGDSTAASYSCQRMRGSPHVFAVVQAIYLRAWQHDVAISFVWQRRSAPNMQLADAPSKRRDDAGRRFSRALGHREVFAERGEPDPDCFAGDVASLCELYFAEFEDGRCAGVGGHAHRWDS